MKTILLFAMLLALGACATLDGGDPEIPDGATSNVYTEANGDVITEYRVGTQLRMVKVEPIGGPAYYLHDNDRDGRVDRNGKAPMTYYKLFSW